MLAYVTVDHANLLLERGRLQAFVLADFLQLLAVVAGAAGDDTAVGRKDVRALSKKISDFYIEKEKSVITS